MNVEKTNLNGLFVITPDVFKDDRGWFMESYNSAKLKNYGIDVNFIQDNHSLSKEMGTIRGIHFQIGEYAQTKLVRCTRGKILDVAVDLRKNSNTYKQWFSIELSAENKKQLFIPKGFGHAFLTLTNDVEVEYKVDVLYSKLHDRSIYYDDKEININWGIENPILSDKDKLAPLLINSDVDF